jgi:alpha-L-fucosidase 2
MTDSVLWYRTPATRWIEALPVGNGRLGAMVFGGVGDERLQLNEDSLWTGGPEDADNPAALPALPKIRQLLFEGRYAEAQGLCDATQVRKASERGDFGSYTTLGELRLVANNPALFAGAPAEYRRDLDLSTAIATTRYRFGERSYSRRCFASAPDQVIVIALDCSANARLDFRLELSRPEGSVAPTSSSTLLLSGRLRQRDEPDGMRYAAMVGVLAVAGRVQSSPSHISVEGAESAVILISAATDYRGGDFEALVAERVEAARSKGLAALLARHAADHRPRFERVALDLPRGAAADLSTDERLLHCARGEPDPALFALYFQLGRYLLAASSRPGSLAANLQGVWADGLVNPWNGDYHTNINVQMNYWLAETGNLAECAEPLVDLTLAMQGPGRQTARVHYAARGWVVHTIHNVWGFTSPGDKPLWGLFPMATPWLCQHLWEHYAFGGDRAFLRRVWPCLEEATRFCLDWLVRDPESGKLVSGPANSPENTFVTPSGELCSICMGPSMDQEILWDHFTNVLAAAAALGIDDEFVREVASARDDLALPQIAGDGRLMEWPLPFGETEPEHRHVSHLFGVHPGRRIAPHTTPKECEAARRTLERRGDGGTGWSRAWKVCFWARLGDGDRAHALFQRLLTPVCLPDTEFAADGPGVYPNLFCAHPPFQIDGNLGGAAAIAEMLLQSHDGTIHLLPALPSAWPSGRASGLCARGGFELELAWHDGRLARARLRSLCGNACEVRHRGRSVQLETIAGRDYDLSAELCAEADIAARVHPAGGRR